MCPECISTLALVAGSVTSAGGMAALIVKKICPKSLTQKITTQTSTKENPDGE